MFEDAISMLSIFGSMNTWLTPMVLFVLLNLMIGTIAFTSSFTSHKDKPNHHHHNNHHQNHHFHNPQPPLQNTFTRSPSVLQRLKSTISFSNFYTHHYHQPSTTTNTTYFQPPQPNQEPKLEPEPEPEPEPFISNEVEEDKDEDEGPTLDEVYSRIKQASINPHYGRQNSDTKPSNGEIPVKLPQKMKKSASDKSAFNHFELHNVHVGPGGASILEDGDDDMDNIEYEEEQEEQEEQEEGVDAKADDFINKFKKQLQLQRKESILRYKQMIHSRT